MICTATAELSPDMHEWSQTFNKTQANAKRRRNDAASFFLSLKNMQRVDAIKAGSGRAWLNDNILVEVAHPKNHGTTTKRHEIGRSRVGCAVIR